LLRALLRQIVAAEYEDMKILYPAHR